MFEQVIKLIESQIDLRQQRDCVPCQTGKCLMALKAAKEALLVCFPDEPDAEPFPSVEQPEPDIKSSQRPGRPRGAKSKATEKSGKTRRDKFETNRLAVLEHLAQNGPTSGSAIGRALGYTKSGITQILHKIRKLGQIEQHGRGVHATYALPAKSAPAPEVEKKRDPGIIYGSKPNGATIPPLTFRCEPCHAAFASQKQLDEHNKIRHNGSQAEDHKWQCDLCERVFATEDQLLDHVDLRHGR